MNADGSSGRPHQVTGEETEKPYHHGNLRTALVDAGEAELREKGVEKFSLRSVAKRAGVSHSAPAHHFGDIDGLLTALAARSFRKHLAAMEAQEAAAASDATEQIVAAGLGYILYASENSAMFGLQFASYRPDRSDPELVAASVDTFRHLVVLVNNLIAARKGQGSGDEPGATKSEMLEGALAQGSLATIHIIWAVAHGIAALYTNHETPYFSGLTDAEKKQEWARMLRQVAMNVVP